MAMPRKLKNFNVFGNGESFLGLVQSVTLPTLTRKMEEYRGGGMGGPVSVDFGQEAIEMESTFGGPMRSILRQYGLATHDGVMLRFAGSLQRDDTAEVESCEVVVRGRHTEIEFGDAEAGEDSEFSVTTACSYYKLTIGGEVLIEIDLLNMIEIVGGEDRMAQHRAAIGA